MRRLPALVPWSATSRSRAAPCCSGSSSQSSSLWPSWRAAEGDVAGASGGGVVAGGGAAGAEAEVVAASAGSVVGVGSQAAAREGASSMASKLTVEQFAAEVARALSARLVALLLYGSWARGTHVPDRSDVNTLLICDTVDDALFATTRSRDARLDPRGPPCAPHPDRAGVAGVRGRVPDRIRRHARRAPTARRARPLARHPGGPRPAAAPARARAHG